MLTPRSWWARYACWLLDAAPARRRALLAFMALASCLCAAATLTLPLHTDTTWLLPEDSPAVRDTRALLRRKPATAVVEVGVLAQDADVARRFAAELAGALRRRVPAALLREVDEDDSALRRFFWEQRHLYASVAELSAARDALRRAQAEAAARRNPLLVDLEEEPARSPALEEDPPVRALLERLRDARARALAPPGYSAQEGRLRLLLVRAPFTDTEPDKAQALIQGIHDTVAALQPARYGAGLSVGVTGEPVISAHEHDVILGDMLLTGVLCFSAVLLFLLAITRSLRRVAALGLTLCAGCALTFALCRAVIGHLNAATALLGSIVAGNGINYGLMLVARYQEERPRAPALAALHTAMAATARPTFVAALAASLAYLTLCTTRFRGFSEFGFITSTGMLICWAAAYSLLPVLLLAWDREGRIGPAVVDREGRIGPAVVDREGRIGPAVVDREGRIGPAVVDRDPPPRAPPPARPAARRGAAAGPIAGLLLLVITAAALYGGARFLRAPFEDDLSKLVSRSLLGSELGRWMERLQQAFGRDRSGGFYLGVERPEQVPRLLAALQALEAGVPTAARLLGRVEALPLLLPGDAAEQRRKLALLQELRGLMARVSPPPESALARDWADLQPPAGLQILTVRDLPTPLLAAFTESDGRSGLLLTVRQGPGYRAGSAACRKRVVALLRSMNLDPELRAALQLAGADVLYADMMSTVERDGPRAGALAFALVLVLLLFTFGPRREAAIGALALLVGVFGTLALMAVLRVRLNFLNYIALPITMGIGADYPYNVSSRLLAERRAGRDPLAGLWRTGAAVAACSATTLIGYGALLFSDHGAIRSFGLTAGLGELSCLIAGLLFTPVLLLRQER